MCAEFSHYGLTYIVLTTVLSARLSMIAAQPGLTPSGIRASLCPAHPLIMLHA